MATGNRPGERLFTFPGRRSGLTRDDISKPWAVATVWLGDQGLGRNMIEENIGAKGMWIDLSEWAKT